MQINLTELRKRKIFFATPMYGGQCAGMFTKSVVDLSVLCEKHGIQIQHYFLFNESLITRARNYCCDEFIRSDCTHLLFMDSDIGFNAQDVLAMLALQSEDSPYDVLCAPYPKKTICWEKIVTAVDKGMADENPNNLEKYVGDYVFNPVSGSNQIALNAPAEVLESGTGFMMIKRSAFELFDKAFPEQSYKPDHVRTKHFDGSREIMAYFDCVIDPTTKRYLSEDYMFCQYVRNAGGKVWLCPWIRTHHMGMYVFGGSLVDIASIGVAATADISKLGKKSE